jgi:hypothetical protein
MANRNNEEGLALIEALQEILHGSRDPALAENPALGYEFAAEVQLLLEQLGGEHRADPGG